MATFWRYMVVALSGVGLHTGTAQPVTSGGRALPRAALDTFFLAQDPFAPGIAFSIEQDGHILYRRVVGRADLSEAAPPGAAGAPNGIAGAANGIAGAPLDPSSNFRMASVTKQFTAMGILLLAKDGRLSLEDPLRRWLPELPADIGARIRIRHLLTHSSGLIDYESLIPPEQSRQVLDEDVLHLLGHVDSTYFPPGTQFRYSNSGFCLLALIIERASGQSFADFIRDRIFRPLHMNGSVVYGEGRPIPHRAMGFRRDSTGRVVPSDQSVTSATKGDGGVYTSLEDYARWNRALQVHTLLDPDAVLGQLRFPVGPSGASPQASAASPQPSATSPQPSATSPQAAATMPPGSGASGYYAAGWFLLDSPVATWFHSGSTCGFSNFVVRIPPERWTMVFFSNLADNEAPFRKILGILKAAGYKDLDGVMALHDMTR